MTREEHLLIILSEECSEVIKEITKSLRFGLDDFHPKYDNEPNRLRLKNELCDLVAMIEMLQNENVIEDLPREKIDFKKDKVEKYLLYSKDLGRL